MKHEISGVSPTVRRALDAYLEAYASTLLDRASEISPNGEVEVPDIMAAVRDEEFLEFGARSRRQRRNRLYSVLGLSYAMAGVMLSLIATIWSAFYDQSFTDLLQRDPILIISIAGLAIATVGILISIIVQRESYKRQQIRLGLVTPTATEWFAAEKKNNNVVHFLKTWNEVDAVVREISTQVSREDGESDKSGRIPSSILLRRLTRPNSHGPVLPRSSVMEYDDLKRTRNMLVHGQIDDFSGAEVASALVRLKLLATELRDYRDSLYGGAISFE